MASKRIALLLFLALLQLGCTRTSDQANSASIGKNPKEDSRSDKKISEDQALSLLISELKAHKVRDLDCLAFQNESGRPAQSKAELWDFAARELHNERCGGDPAVFPVRDRYQISSEGKASVYDVVTGQYKRL